MTATWVLPVTVRFRPNDVVSAHVVSGSTEVTNCDRLQFSGSKMLLMSRAPCKNSEHFNTVVHGPVKNDKGRNDKATKTGPKLVTLLAHIRETNMHPATLQDGINHPVGGIGVLSCDVGPRVVKVCLSPLAQPRLGHAGSVPLVRPDASGLVF